MRTEVQDFELGEMVRAELLESLASDPAAREVQPFQTVELMENLHGPISDFVVGWIRMVVLRLRKSSPFHRARERDSMPALLMKFEATSRHIYQAKVGSAWTAISCWPNLPCRGP